MGKGIYTHVSPLAIPYFQQRFDSKEYLPDISVSVLFLEAYIDYNGPIDELGRQRERERGVQKIPSKKIQDEIVTILPYIYVIFKKSFFNYFLFQCVRTLLKPCPCSVGGLFFGPVYIYIYISLFN